MTATASAQPPPTRVPDQPAWYESALRFVPPGYVAGYAIRSDEQKLKGIVPVFPATADDPTKPASAFDRGQVLEVELKRNGNALDAASATLRPREPDETGAPQGTSSSDQTRQFVDINRAIETKFKNLPPGTMACNFGAYSIDKDRNGLNVRAEPSAQAHILGTLPPPYSFKAKGNNVPEAAGAPSFSSSASRTAGFSFRARSRRARSTRTRESIRRTIPAPMPGAAGSPATRSARTSPTARRGRAGCFRPRTPTPGGGASPTATATRSAGTRARTASSPAPASGRWWRRTVSAAGGATSAPTR